LAADRLAIVARSAATGYAAALLAPVVVLYVVQYLRLPAFVFEHLILLLVVACAVAWGVGPAIVGAIVAVSGDNLLLREPIGQPAISGLRDVLDLILFIGVAVWVGWLVRSAQVQRLRAEQAAERERRAREDRDRLIATISHDLATPLSAIRGSIQFAQRFGTEANLDLDKLLDRLDTAASRASSLLEMLRDTQALERGELLLNRQAADLRDIVLPIVRMLDRVSERHPVVVHVPEQPILVHVDTNRLQRVVENLLTNAIKYSPSGGTVEVIVGVDNRTAVVTVRDQGIGISPDALPRIFEMSFRAPEAVATTPGLGLGLSIAIEIAQRHGGTIDVRQVEPRGTLFSLRLPLLASETTLHAAAADTALVARRAAQVD
jgi:signal transduction histidine kinase